MTVKVRVSRYRQDSNFDGETLVFLHVAKTGGATLGHILSKNVPIESQLPVSPMHAATAIGTWALQDVADALEAWNFSHGGPIRLVGGHLPYGVHQLFKQRVAYLTMLREPVDRVLSGYYYSIERHRVATHEDVTLTDYVRKRSVIPILLQS